MQNIHASGAKVQVRPAEPYPAATASYNYADLTEALSASEATLDRSGGYNPTEVSLQAP